MNMIHYIKKKLTTRLTMLGVLLFQTLLVAAADKVYIENFSIKAGETKTIALNFDTDQSTYNRIKGTLVMPEGLKVIEQTHGNRLTGEPTRGIAAANYKASDGALTLQSLSYITAGTGAIGYFMVQASEDIPATGTITLSNFTAHDKSTNTDVPCQTENCTVTREAGEGGSGEGGGEETPTGKDLTYQFNPASLTMKGGETKTVEVQMTNVPTFSGIQGVLKASDGLTIVSAAPSSRIIGWNGFYNDATQEYVIMTMGAVTGNEGTVFTVTLKADDNFVGEATLKAYELGATTSDATDYAADDINLTVTVESKYSVSMSLSKDVVYLGAGGSVDVDLMLSGNADLTGYNGTLTLPQNVTATWSKGDLTATQPLYEPTTGVFLYSGPITAQEGKLATLTLTANDEFAADGEVKLTEISTTTASSVDIPVADITLQVTAKPAATVTTAPAAVDGLVYTGEAQALVTAGAAEGGEMQYSLDNVTYSTEVPTGLNAGNYTIYYKVVADANHNDAAALSVAVTIAKAALTEVTLATTTLYFSGTEQTVNVSSVKAGTIEVPATDYTVTGNKATAIGTYPVVVTANADAQNFTGQATTQFEMVQAALIEYAIDAFDENGQKVNGVTVSTTADENNNTLTIEKLNVPDGNTDELSVNIPTQLNDYDVVAIADNAFAGQNVTDVYMPDTENPITVGNNAIPGLAVIHTSLALLDDYALMATLGQNYQNLKVMTTVRPVNRLWTLGTGVDVIIPEDIIVSKVQALNNSEVQVTNLTESELNLGGQRVVKANNGVLLEGQTGTSYDLVAYGGRIASGTPVATGDNKDYGTDNCLEPVVEKTHFAAGAYFVMSENEFHAIQSEGDEVKVPAGKAVLHLAGSQSSYARVLRVVDGTTTAIEGVVTAEGRQDWYTIDGRKLGTKPVKGGLYIVNGKKTIVK